MDLRGGTEYVVRSIFLPHLEQNYEQLLTVSQGADLIVSHTLAYAVPLVAEKLGLPWLSVYLQPAGIFSSYDPPALPAAPVLTAARGFGRWPYRAILALGKLASRSWIVPIEALRSRLGLPPSPRHPMVEPYSPYGSLAWFSRLLAVPQPDWPPRTTITGFPFYDKQTAEQAGLDPALEAFLARGEPPVVFTLGSAAVFDPGTFYEQSLIAVRRTGLRAVLLVGEEGMSALSKTTTERIYVGAYAPYSALMPRALLNVHQGGIGTTAQALRSGRPMLVVPFSHDQPDNAERVTKLGVARMIPRSAYTAQKAEAAL